MNQIKDNHKENIDGTTAGVGAKLRAFIAGLTPGAIFRYTLVSTVLVALAATIIYHTATDDIHVNVDKVETATVSLSGASDLGGIGPGEYKAVEYSITNQSTHSAFFFIRFEVNTQNLYEVVSRESSDSGTTALDGWVRVRDAEEPGQLIFAYIGENSGGSTMMPVEISETVVLEGKLHCLADAEMYSQLGGEDMDFDVYGCLVYGSDSSGGSGSGYNTSAAALYQAYLENGGR